jgi:hypothetical protein
LSPGSLANLLGIFSGKQLLPLPLHKILLPRIDWSYLILVFVLTPGLACFDIVLANLWGKNLFDDLEGKAALAAMSLYLLAFYTLFCGVLFALLRFKIFVFTSQSGHQQNRSEVATLFSTIGIAGMYAMYQAIVFTLMRFSTFSLPESANEFPYTWVTLTLFGFTVIMLGFTVSTTLPRPHPIPWLASLIILPVMFLGNFFIVLPEPLPKISPLSWTFKNLVALSGLGSDVISDPCWSFPVDLRQSLTEADKNYYQCRCMGLALFSPGVCHFPGIQSFYQPELDQSPPSEPLVPGGPPPTPEVPPPPQSPEDTLDKQAVEEYQQAMQAYEANINQIQDEYALQMTSYKLRLENYRIQVKGYQEQITHWHTARTNAVASAEHLISSMLKRFGWAFVNKSDQDKYLSELRAGWMAQACFSLFLITLLYFLYKLRSSRYETKN